MGEILMGFSLVGLVAGAIILIRWVRQVRREAELARHALDRLTDEIDRVRGHGLFYKPGRN